MKNPFIYSLLLFCVVSVKAQEITQLEETNVTFQPYVTNVDSYIDNSFSVMVDENYAGEFSKNPIEFMKENFDIHSFISFLDQHKSNGLQKTDYEYYQVTFSTNKGDLVAKFSTDGELEETSQNFKNILVPSDIRRELYRSYKGWKMVKNTYIASGKSDQIDKELYRIKLKNGNKSQIVKIVPDRTGSDIVAIEQ
jgi:hypothetical protein